MQIYHLLFSSRAFYFILFLKEINFEKRFEQKNVQTKEI
jgi:hypothetical protein